MFGAEGRGSGKQRLVNDSKSCFEQGASDSFILRCRDLGPIDRVVIACNREGKDQGWNLAEVIVHNQDKPGGPVRFTAGLWLNSGLGAELFPEGSSRTPKRNIQYHEDDGMVRGAPLAAAVLTAGRPQQLAYEIMVKTADLPGAGTDASVFVVLHGEHGDSRVTELGKSEKFQRASKDHFQLSLPSLAGIGRVTAVTLGHDGSGASPDWDVDTVTVTDIAAASAAAEASEAAATAAAAATRQIHVGARIETSRRGSGKEPSMRIEVPAADGAQYHVTVNTTDIMGAETKSDTYIDGQWENNGAHVSMGTSTTRRFDYSPLPKVSPPERFPQPVSVAAGHLSPQSHQLGTHRQNRLSKLGSDGSPGGGGLGVLTKKDGGSQSMPDGDHSARLL
jgi:hypothetical protein